MTARPCCCGRSCRCAASRSCAPAGGGRPDRILTDGPAKLCQAFGLDRATTAPTSSTDPAITIVDDGTPPPADPLVTPRIGIRVATDVPWRWLAPTT